jgi:hypothetical protein
MSVMTHLLHALKCNKFTQARRGGTFSEPPLHSMLGRISKCYATYSIHQDILDSCSPLLSQLLNCLLQSKHAWATEC